eukprot:scaffold229438_cov19-Tisochrysis_lutea.AAC.1
MLCAQTSQSGYPNNSMLDVATAAFLQDADSLPIDGFKLPTGPRGLALQPMQSLAVLTSQCTYEGACNAIHAEPCCACLTGVCRCVKGEDGKGML